MSKRSLAVVLVAATAALAACGSSGDSATDGESTTVDGASVAVGAAPLPGGAAGSLGDVVEIVAAAPGDASGAACDVDRRALELAAETYELLIGSMPTNQQELLDAQIIRELSVRFEIGADGTVVPAPASPCP